MKMKTPQFIRPSQSHTKKMFELALAFIFILATIAFTCYGVGADDERKKHLEKSREAREWLETVEVGTELGLRCPPTDLLPAFSQYLHYEASSNGRQRVQEFVIDHYPQWRIRAEDGVVVSIHTGPLGKEKLRLSF